MKKYEYLINGITIYVAKAYTKKITHIDIEYIPGPRFEWCWRVRYFYAGAAKAPVDYDTKHFQFRWFAVRWAKKLAKRGYIGRV